MKIPLKSCTVRSWRTGDAPSLVFHANNRKIWMNLRDRFHHPYTLADAEDFLHRVQHTLPETSFAIEVGSTAAGGIGYTLGEDVHRRLAEIGFWLGEPYWGRGIATEALTAICAWAFDHHDLCRLQATVFSWNPTSARVLEKVGFEHEGVLRSAVTKDGQTGDAHIYALIKV